MNESYAMLISERPSPPGILLIMSDLAILAASTRATLLDVARQSAGLGIGLQNAAPGDRAGVPNNSVQYLLETAESLTNLAQQCEQLVISFNKETE